MSKSYFDLTEEERMKRAKLNPKEQAAVDALIAAAKALPRSISIEVSDNFSGDGNLTISKRITPGSCMQVASLVKASLCF